MMDRAPLKNRILALLLTLAVFGFSLLLLYLLPGQGRQEHSGSIDPQETDTVSAPGSGELMIIDADYTLEEALEGLSFPEEAKAELTLIEVTHLGYDSLLHRGQLVVNKELAGEVGTIFELLLEMEFPIEKVIPVVRYHWSDSASMLDNNTSCFNYRTVDGSTKLSDHSLGRAVDINPMQNPYIHLKSQKTVPPQARYNPGTLGTITAGSGPVRIFMERGWKWGGDWTYSKDYQHFYKPE